MIFLFFFGYVLLGGGQAASAWYLMDCRLSVISAPWFLRTACRKQIDLYLILYILQTFNKHDIYCKEVFVAPL